MIGFIMAAYYLLTLLTYFYLLYVILGFNSAVSYTDSTAV